MNKEKLSIKEKFIRAKDKGNISAFLMLLPAVVLLLVISIYPFLWLIRYASFNYNGFEAYFNGLDNFKRAFGDSIYWSSVLHTFEYAIMKIVIVLPLALIVAVILHLGMMGKRAFGAIYFLPTVISPAVYSLIFYFIYAAYNGVLNASLMKFGIIDAPIDWLGDPKIVMISIVIVAVWGGFGNYMIYFTSGLSSISAEVYESSKIDGANGVQTFFKITLPLLGPVMKVIIMLAITTALKDYQSILVLTGGGPNNRSHVMFSYIYQLSFGSVTTQPQLGYSAVLSLISALIIGVVTVIYLKASKNMDDIY
ncbi:MAG: sugar ABC transporter permease [Clostridiales bacterium]|nr:sugar ABC transporter permease [Clostridiales bacterium]